MSRIHLESLLRIHANHLHDGRDRYQRANTLRLMRKIRAALRGAV